MSDFKNVGGAWEKSGRNGPFISARVQLPDGTETTLLLFRNKHKVNSLDGRPDFIVCQPVSTPEPVTEHPF